MMKETGWILNAVNTMGLMSEQVMLASSDQPLDLSQVNVQIQVPTKNEEPYIEKTLRTIQDQLHVRNGEVSVVLVDSSSDDGTRQEAQGLVNEIWAAPDGKLSARNWAMKKTNADIVVTADAADLYPQGWLSNLLKPFTRADVIATHGPKCSQDPLWKGAMGLYNWVRPNYNFSASNSAIRTHAFWEAGGFNENIDQFDRDQMFLEEERAFPERLQQYGHIIYVPSAAMLTSMRQNKFSIQHDNDYQSQRDNGERF